MKMAYTEIGIGNPTFINTEVEFPNGSETRQPGFVRFARFRAVYVRLWLGKTVYAADTHLGFTRKTKPRKTFKLLFGISGEIA